MSIEIFGEAGEDFGDVFRLYFTTSKPGETGKAKAWVVLGRTICGPHLHGNISLTAECLSYSELDCQVDWLIQFLEKVRKQARKKFQRWEAERRTAASKWRGET